MLHHPAFTLAPKRASARSFFETHAPAILKAAHPSLHRASAKLAVSLEGEGGGDWTLNLETLDVEDGLAPDAALLVRSSPIHFEKMLAGKLDVSSSLRAGHLRISGSMGALELFVALFQH